MSLREDGNGVKPPDGKVTPAPGGVTAVTVTQGGGGRTPPPPDPPDSGDEEEDGMRRMSFMKHLEELRSRLLKMLAGLGVAFMLSLTFCQEVWKAVAMPAVDALTKLGIHPATLKAITPMEQFNVIWVKLPILCAIFIASPWVVYQVWAFISPGPGLEQAGGAPCGALRAQYGGALSGGRSVRLFRGFPLRIDVSAGHRTG